jgi:hypothetical protein
MPSVTVTTTSTRLSTPAFTPTSTNTNVIINTPTPVPTADTFKIEGQICYPNPYNPLIGEDLHLQFNISQDADRITFKVYTVGFRAVKEKTWTGNFSAGRISDVTMPAREFSNYANGTYYYVIEGESTQGKKARSRADIIIILK